MTTHGSITNGTDKSPFSNLFRKEDLHRFSPKTGIGNGRCRFSVNGNLRSNSHATFLWCSCDFIFSHILHLHFCSIVCALRHFYCFIIGSTFITCFLFTQNNSSTAQKRNMDEMEVCVARHRKEKKDLQGMVVSRYLLSKMDNSDHVIWSLWL